MEDKITAAGERVHARFPAAVIYFFRGTIAYGRLDIRVYLKTGNMTNSEGFFAC
jgi:hypothetical protein